MKRWFLLFLCVFLLGACGAPATATNTHVPPTATATTVPTVTAIPTPTPTEAAPVIELDQPMTTEFDLTNTDVMPSTDEEMVRKGDLREAVRQYWQETGVINPDGSINKPENVIPAKPDQWRLTTYLGDISKNYPGGDTFLGPVVGENDPNRYAPMADNAFQPTNLLFKVKDKDGNVTGVLVTEALYYIDPSGKVAVEPVFFFVSLSKTSNPRLVKIFGHDEKFDSVCWPYVGVKDGEEGYESWIVKFIEDKAAYLGEPMQEDREAFAQQVDITSNPEGMGNFWWAPQGIAAAHP